MLAEFIRRLLCFLTDSKAFNSIQKEIRVALPTHQFFYEESRSCDSSGEEEEGKWSFRWDERGEERKIRIALWKTVSEIRSLAERVPSLQSVCRVKIIRTLISSGRANSLLEGVRQLKSCGSLRLPPTLEDFLL